MKTDVNGKPRVNLPVLATTVIGRETSMGFRLGRIFCSVVCDVGYIISLGT